MRRECRKNENAFPPRPPSHRAVYGTTNYVVLYTKRRKSMSHVAKSHAARVVRVRWQSLGACSFVGKMFWRKPPVELPAGGHAAAKVPDVRALRLGTRMRGWGVSQTPPPACDV